MNLQAEPMTERVAEGVPEPASGDDLPGQGVPFAGRHSGPEVLQRPTLRALDYVVHGQLTLVGSGTHDHGPRQVRAVAINPCSEVDQEQLPPAHRALAGSRVRQLRSFSGCYNGCEGVPLTALPSEPPCQDGT